MTANGDMIIALDKERMQAMADKDIGKLKNMLCKDLVYTHSSARLDTKESIIAGMESGATVYNSVVPSNVEALDLGDDLSLGLVVQGAGRFVHHQHAASVVKGPGEGDPLALSTRETHPTLPQNRVHSLGQLLHQLTQARLSQGFLQA